MGRLDVEMYDSLNNWSFREFSLACPFFVKMSGWFVFCITVLIMSCCSFMIVSFFVVVPECFPNGTITVIIPKLESVPHLHPGELSLRDPACKPYDIEDYFAYFHFNVTSCGTTRKVQWRHTHQTICTTSVYVVKVIHILFCMFSLLGIPWYMRMKSHGRKMNLCHKPLKTLRQNTG